MTERSIILIADGNEARAKRISEACETRGLPTRTAPHGAAALEASLSEVPEVLVAPYDLPLIDAAKLAEILRANPRTQHVRVVFLGRVDSASGADRFFDEVVEPGSDPDEVALRIEAIVARQERLHAMEHDQHSANELQGQLSQVPLTDLLQLFHMNRRTGTLDLLRRESAPGGEEHGLIQVRDGNILQAQVGTVEGEKALFRLLAWTDGSFAFAPPRGDATPRILTPTRALLMEGVRQLDEWEQMKAELPAPESRVTLRVESIELPKMVHPLTQEVLLLLELYSRVQDVVDQSSFPDYQVLRTLQTLVRRGLVEISEEAAASLAPTSGLVGPAQARRLRDWMRTFQPRGGHRADAKLLLVASEPSALDEFLGLLKRLPGLRLEVPKRPRSGLELARVARLAVDGEFGIQFVHLPATQNFAPLWPLAGHGALGTIFLLGGSVDRALKAIGPVRDALRRLPRPRHFHVLLKRPDEPAVADEIRENLALLDEGAAFLVNVEAGKEPLQVLRNLFARVLP